MKQFVMHTIRLILGLLFAGVIPASAQTYTFTRLAGTSSVGHDDGSGSAARFAFPVGVAIDGNGSLFVADSRNHVIRKVTAAGVVTTLAGLAGNDGSADGTGSVRAVLRSPGRRGG